jgi:hypothetical protein
MTIFRLVGQNTNLLFEGGLRVLEQWQGALRAEAVSVVAIYGMAEAIPLSKTGKDLLWKPAKDLSF